MALADGSPGYTPPANIVAYRREHWELPRLWASPGDIVWDGESPLAHLFERGKQPPEICPWGWSPALVHRLELAGVPRQLMPDDAWLGRLRRLSGRESTVPVQQSLGVDARVCRSLDDVGGCMRQWERVMMKSPWSSSGKGLMQTDNPNWQGWVRRILRLQGAVVVERLVEKQQDFALEFMMDGGKVEYMGLNIFRTDAHGRFLDNVNASEPANRNLICSLLKNPGELDSLCRWYAGHLPRLAPWYHGPVGVDLLVTRDGTIHPCVEINWRMTMGMVEVMTRMSENKSRG